MLLQQCNLITGAVFRLLKVSGWIKNGMLQSLRRTPSEDDATLMLARTRSNRETMIHTGRLEDNDKQASTTFKLSLQREHVASYQLRCELYNYDS